MNLSKKINTVQYIGEHLHYSISFDDNSTSTVPRKHIDDYIDSGGKDGGHEIVTCLSISIRSI